MRDLFWMIYSPTGGAPTVQHETSTKAHNEAARLAKKQPGHSFYVLQSIAKVATPPAVIVTQINGAIPRFARVEDSETVPL